MNGRSQTTPGLLDYGRLLRLSLAPSAIADVVAGSLLGAGAWAGPSTLWLIAASLCVYHGGMALNDWADREHDARTRPERPIPSGAIAPGHGLLLAVFLLAAGPLLASQADSALLLYYAALALAVATYDMVGRGPWIGPLLLALCRGGNLAAGLLFGLRAAQPATTWEPAFLAIPAAYAGYVFFVSRLGRLEDGEDEHPLGRRPAGLIAAAVALFCVLPILPIVPRPRPEDDDLARLFFDTRILASTLVVAVGAFLPLRLAFRVGDWTRAGVISAMGVLLRRLLVFDVAVAFAVGSPSAALTGALLLLGFPLSSKLRGLFPPS